MPIPPNDLDLTFSRLLRKAAPSLPLTINENFYSMFSYFLREITYFAPIVAIRARAAVV